MVGLQTAETGLDAVHNVAARSPDIIPPWADAAIAWNEIVTSVHMKIVCPLNSLLSGIHEWTCA
jgi:hypothetical protein